MHAVSQCHSYGKVIDETYTGLDSYLTVEETASWGDLVSRGTLQFMHRHPEQ